MGHFARAATKAGLGYPNPGWAPPFGSAGLTVSGVPLTYEMAMGVSAFTAGIRLIAEDIASLPIIVYRRLDKGKERAPEHFAYGLLHDSPNPEMTAMVFKETGVGHMYSWGNWFAEKELNGSGATRHLWPLRPDRMTVETDSGKRIYKYRLPNGTGIVLPAERVFHVPGFGFDGLVGYSRVKLMRRQIEGALAVEEYGLRTFSTGARPGVVIRHPLQLSNGAKTNIVNSWDERHAGLSNAERTAILDEGMDIETLGFSMQDAQFLESRHFSVEEIARGLRLSPHKLSDLSRATFNNIEELNIEHAVGTLGPPIARIDQQINKDIIADPDFFAEHLLDALMRGKTLDRYTAYRMASGGVAWMNGDDIRDKENMNPMPDGQGQVYLAPLNTSPIDLLAEAVTANSGKADEAMVELAERDVEARKEFNAAIAALARSAPQLTIAKGAIQNDIHAPAVTVEAPPAANVTVNAPEQAPPVVNVTVEAPKPTTRTVSRGDGTIIGTITEVPDGE